MNPTFQIDENTLYIHNTAHRDGTPTKSQWSIDGDAERDCFFRAYKQAWYSSASECWGLYLVNLDAEYLGEAADTAPNSGESLFIAKFVDGNKDSIWHGYPANPSYNNQDIPPSMIIKEWQTQGYIRLVVARRLIRGQKCRL